MYSNWSQDAHDEILDFNFEKRRLNEELNQCSGYWFVHDSAGVLRRRRYARARIWYPICGSRSSFRGRRVVVSQAQSINRQLVQRQSAAFQRLIHLCYVTT